jgi:spore coat protein U-like protein
VTNVQPTANLTVYGQVNSGQDPAPGTYNDTITVTVNY